MKPYIVLFLIMINIPLTANAIVCQAKLPETYCSSGKVWVELNKKKQTYEMNLGVIRCWGMDIKDRGSYVKKKNALNYYPDTHQYKLSSMSYSGLTAELIMEAYEKKDEMRYEKRERLAILNIKSQKAFDSQLLRKHYNLICSK